MRKLLYPEDLFLPKVGENGLTIQKYFYSAQGMILLLELNEKINEHRNFYSLC